MSPLDPVVAQSPEQRAMARSTSIQLGETLTPPSMATRSQNLSAKRPRNEDNRFVLPPCATPAKLELEPIEIFVSGTISSPGQQAYRSIVDCIRKRNDANMLHRLLIVLRTNGQTLTHLIKAPKEHAELLHTIFRLDPFVVPVKMANDEDFHRLINSFQIADAHLHLVVAIVSANSTFLNPALNALWKLVVLYDRTDEELQEGRNMRAHAALATLIRLIPSGISDFFPIISNNFPFRARRNVVFYANECLKVLAYAPTLEPKILELLIEKALEMDVEIKIKEGGDVEVDEEVLVKPCEDDAIFDLELDDSTKKRDVKAERDPAEQKIDEMADKLDNVMCSIFQHVEGRVLNDPQAATSLFQMILPVFEGTILTTHRSKYVQFILFYVCGNLQNNDSDVTDIYRDFAGNLIDAVMDPYRATITRQSAACYLASFVSRAKYVCPETACETVAALLRWAETYLTHLQQTPLGNDYRSLCDLHSLFYTVCQAAFYIMCFRGTEAVTYYRAAADYFEKNPGPSDDETPYLDLDHINMEPERWAKICGHRLQPLRFCLESVREEFILVAEVFSLLPPQLVKNLDQDAQQQSSQPRRRGKSISTPASMVGRRIKGGVGGLGRGSNPLDSFFPFDPYLLQNSHRFVDPIYRNWERSIEEEHDVGLFDAETEEVDADFDDVEDVDTDDEGDDGEDHQSENDDEESLGGRAHMPASVDSTTFLERMSYNSGSSLSNSMPKSSIEHHQSLQVAWSSVLKRPRAPSIAEAGSW